jgi:hypothetical protein
VCQIRHPTICDTRRPVSLCRLAPMSKRCRGCSATLGGVRVRDGAKLITSARAERRRRIRRRKRRRHTVTVRFPTARGQGAARSPRHRRHSAGPPPPRDHRKPVRRSHRRTTGAPAGPVRRQLGLGVVRGHRAQPAARRRDPRGDRHVRAKGTLQRRIVNIPARFSRPQHRPVLHLPSHWPWHRPWFRLWRNTIGYTPPLLTTPVHPAKRPDRRKQEKLDRPADASHPHTDNQDQQPGHMSTAAPSWIQSSAGGSFKCRPYTLLYRMDSAQQPGRDKHRQQNGAAA